jgi:hypothetical protein
MSEHKNTTARGRTMQDPGRYTTPARKREAEKINAVAALQRAARRCARHLGRGCSAGLLEIVSAELGGGAK